MRGLPKWLGGTGGAAPQPLPTPDAYALWAESYPPHPHNALMEAEQSVVAPLIEAAVPRRALDVGSGTGRNLSLCRAAGARLAVGVDLSMPMLARRLKGTWGVCADACQLPFPDSAFDLVCSSLMVGDIATLAAWVSEAERVLAPGGHLVYSDFHPSWSAQGWRRTFQTPGGRSFELGYFAHDIDEHLGLLEAASLEVKQIREPRIAERTAPVVVAFHAVKPGPFVSGPQRRWPR
jgi:malonyl-CoA O-methyltransferase